MDRKLQSLMIAHGALVFLVGLLAGFPWAFLVIGKVVLWPIPGAIEWTVPGDVRAWRMAHLEGILNGLTLIGVAAVGDRLALGERAQRVVAWALVATAWGNVVASVIGPSRADAASPSVEGSRTASCTCCSSPPSSR
jgi:hypothetical protein